MEEKVFTYQSITERMSNKITAMLKYIVRKFGGDSAYMLDVTMIVYLSDRLHLQHGRTISGCTVIKVDSFISPVQLEIFNLFNSDKSVKGLEIIGGILFLKDENIDMDQLSNTDVEAIDKVISLFPTILDEKLILVHDYAWNNTKYEYDKIDMAISEGFQGDLLEILRNKKLETGLN